MLVENAVKNLKWLKRFILFLMVHIIGFIVKVVERVDSIKMSEEWESIKTSEEWESIKSYKKKDSTSCHSCIHWDEYMENYDCKVCFMGDMYKKRDELW